jgi:hypothetical protein
LKRLKSPTADGDTATCCGKALGNSGADSRSASGDGNDFSCKLTHASLSISILMLG